MIRDDPTQTVRIKAVQVVEFLTSSPTYTIAVSNWDQDLPKLLRFMMARLPAATENDLHDFLKSALGKGWKEVKKQASNPDNWMKAAEFALPLLLSM